MYNYIGSPKFSKWRKSKMAFNKYKNTKYGFMLNKYVPKIITRITLPAKSFNNVEVLKLNISFSSFFFSTKPSLCK